MAFGTGQHATTHGCLELLVDRPPGPVLDIGCGSGVLAIAAARLGHAPVRAIDNDPEAVAATAANAAANGVSVDVRLEVAGAEPLPAAALVLANLTLTDLVAVAPFLHAPGAVIASGVRDHEVAVLADALAPRGLAASRTVARDGWAAVLFEAGP